MVLRGRLISIIYSKRRTIFRPVFPLIVKPRGGDIGMTQPLLHLGNIGIVLQGVCRRRRPQRMHAEAMHRSILVGRV